MCELSINDEYIKCFNNGDSIWDISKKYNDTFKNISEIVTGHRFEARLLPDIEKENIKTLYLSGMSTPKIGKLYGVNNKPIARVLDEFGISRSQKDMVRKYKVDETFFDTIDTQDKAYCLGLMSADGSVNPSKCTISISLEDCDKDLLESVRMAIKSEKPLEFLDYSNKHDFGYNYKNQYRLLVFCKHMCDSLQNNGIIQNKSLKLEFPSFISDDLKSHFVRGYFDGDGSMGYKNVESYIKHNCPGLNVSIVSTHNFCIELQKYLESINMSCYVSDPIKKNNITSYLNIRGKSCKDFLDWIYKDANIYLKRKHDIYNYHYGLY